MKKIFILILIFYIIILKTCMAYASIEEVIYNESEIANIADKSENISQIMPNFSFSELIDQLKNGNMVFNPSNIISSFLKIFANEVYTNINIMLVLIIISIIWGIITNIQSSYNSKSISNASFFAFYAIFLGLILNGLKECVELATYVISDQVIFMQTAVPVYSALMMSTGNFSSAVSMEPIFLYFIQIIGRLLQNIVLPLTFWISVLNMISCISEKYNIKKLISFIKQIIKWGLGLIMTFFVGILSMSGFTYSSADSLGIKTLKFAVGNFVPVVGGFLSDSINTVIASTAVLKNAMGTLGVIVVILMCSMPMIKILSVILLYKFTSGIIEPMSDKRMTTMISEAGEAATFIFLIMLAVTIMFILGITIVINVGNIP